MRYRNIETGVIVGVADDLVLSSQTWENLGASPTRAKAAAPAAGDGLFDPSANTVDAILEHLNGADEDERARVLAAEADGKDRATVRAWTAPAVD